jgi:hypothetical protein
MHWMIYFFISRTTVNYVLTDWHAAMLSWFICLSCRGFTIYIYFLCSFLWLTQFCIFFLHILVFFFDMCVFLACLFGIFCLTLWQGITCVSVFFSNKRKISRIYMYIVDIKKRKNLTFVQINDLLMIFMERR